jgi:4-hydroxybenzoate polyprenyltransferase
VSDRQGGAIVSLVRACHPGPTVAVTTIAVMLGLSAGLEVGWLTVVGMTVLVGQVSIGWSNDWWDAARDSAAGRLDKPAAQGDVATTTVRAAALAAGAVAVPLSFLAGWVGTWHMVLVTSGWTYTLGLKSTPWSPLPYFVGFASLPLYAVGVSGVAVPWWMAVAGGLLGVAAHFANAAPDIDQDRAAGVLGLPQRFGARPSVVIALVVLGGAGVLLLSQLGLSGWARFAATAAVALPLIAGSARVIAHRMGRPVFVLVMMSAVTDVALLTVAA